MNIEPNYPTSKPKSRSSWQKVAFSAYFAAISVLGFSSPTKADIPEINRSPDPYALYGPCGPNSAMASKPFITHQLGETMEGVLAMTVLECQSFTGGGGLAKVPCPEGSPYAYCAFADNDGLGNLIKLGVLKTGFVTDPNHLYRGCPANAIRQAKSALVEEAGKDLRLVNGVVTISCKRATVPRSPVRVVACPAGPNPYAYCLRTKNDGKGNEVTLGVVAANGAGDPYGMYGNCYTLAPQLGFRRKSVIVTKIGKSLKNVKSIVLLDCVAPTSSPGIPPYLVEVPCDRMYGGYIPEFVQYDYCIWGADDRGNYLRVGVVTVPKQQ